MDSPRMRTMAKRSLDLFGACVGLLLLAPILVILLLVVRAQLGRPVFFRQERIGLGGRPFVMYKFRTMTEGQTPDGSVLPDASRLTPFGRWLRSTSLDELPELWNVVAGDMSLVGPRPLLPSYLPRYSPFQARRHEVRPGITGWAQVNGRNAVSWDERLSLDVWYVDHSTFLLDIRILWRTVLQVVRRSNVNAEGYATMPEFLGQDDLMKGSDE